MISLHSLEKRIRRRLKLDENKKISDWLHIFEDVAVSAKKKPKKQIAKFKAQSASKATPDKVVPTKRPKPKPKPIEVKWQEVYCGDDEIECWIDPTWRSINGWNKVNIRLHYCGTIGDHFEREYPATEKGKPVMITEDYGIAL